jgi:hypothetical protein
MLIPGSALFISGYTNLDIEVIDKGALVALS